jgi:hypothetical protein
LIALIFDLYYNILGMEHVHGPNCGCKDYLGVENANDLLGAIDL